MPIVIHRRMRGGPPRLLAALSIASLAACVATPAGRSALPSPRVAPPTRGPAERWREVERYLAAELRAGDVPRAAVGVIRGDVAWTRGFGVSDGARAAAITGSSRFPIASVSKLFTGVVVLHLVERGVLRLDEPVAGRVPELAALLSPPGDPPVTLRHLLTHTAGLPDLVDGAVDLRGRVVAMDEARFLAAVAAARVVPAGARRAYSSTGVALAGLVAARAAGAPFEELLERAVLTPLGMSSTALGGQGAPAGAYGPAGGMRSTADDLIRFARFELGLLEAPEVLSPGEVAASQVDDPLPGEGGLAWLTGRSRGEPFVAHAGAIDGHAAAIVLFPRLRAGAVVLLDRLVPGAQCLAVSLARVAVDGAASGRPCLGRAARLTAAERAAIDALVAALEDPSAEALAPLLSPRLAAAVPAQVLAAGLGQLGRAAGRCRGHSIAASAGGAVEVRVDCMRGPLRLRVTLAPGGRGLLAGVQALD